MDKAPRPGHKQARAESNLTEFPILQFGASRFLQAHVDLFVSEALPRGEAMGPIAVAGTTGSPESRRRVAAFAAGQPYPVLVKGLSEGAIVDEIVKVSSVGAGLDAATQWDELERLFIAARCAVSNTADRGYETDPDDRLDAGPPRSFPAKLAKLLLARSSRRRKADHPLPLRADADERSGPAGRGAGRARSLAGAAGSAPLGRGGVRLGQFAGRPHRLRAARALGRGRRALCVMGDRGPAGPRIALPASRHRRRRRPEALRAPEAVHPQSRPHLSRRALGQRRRRAKPDGPRGRGRHNDAHETRCPLRGGSAASVRRRSVWETRRTLT